MIVFVACVATFTGASSMSWNVDCDPFQCTTTNQAVCNEQLRQADLRSIDKHISPPSLPV